MGEVIILGPSPNDAVLINRGEPTGFDTLRGGQGDDTLGFEFGVEGYVFGDRGNDFITGTVPGKAANMFGGDGDDTIVGLGGPSFMQGNQGNDSIVGSESNDSIRGGQDNDTIEGDLGNDTIHGDNGNDFIVGDDPSFGIGFGDLSITRDIILGNQGEDTIFGSDGSDTIYGGQGDDLIDIFTEDLDHTGGSDVIFGDLGNDTIGREDSDNPNNPETGVPGNDTLLGGEGNDSVVGGYGEDDLFGDEGNDTVRGGLAGRDFLNGGDGDDSLLGGDESFPTDPNFIFGDTIEGGAGNDTILGEGGDDSIDGGIGDDSIEGGDGRDTLAGGEGEDWIVGDDGNDSIEDGDDIDTLFGENGSDTILGGDGDDTIDGGDGDDSLIGGLGEDALEGGAGSDTLIGNEVGAVAADAGDLFIYDLVDVTEVSGGPQAVTQQQADFIQSFDVNNDILLIEDRTFTIAGQTVTYGDVFSDANADGMGSADLGQIGAAQVGNDTVIYLENGALGSGYNNDADVALATLLGVQANTVTSNNFDLIE
ncbi:MAG: calcium-binding protein [Hormoscilla sp. SP5CHS1]|nr:calcium-binding protein [Hormoscilla sp. SP5CHS1]